MTNLLVQRRKQAPSRASKSRYPQPPAPVGSVPVALPSGKKGSPLLFTSDEGVAGKTRVRMTGRYHLKGSATMEDPLPADLDGMHFELRWQGPGQGGEPEAEPGAEGLAPDAGEPAGQDQEEAWQ
ncbi:MAG TPA: hypothetical protein VKL22_09025 [Actinomycetota bacterium]|nr:hypothetical protein [Actinomycetota bacterium]